MSQNLLRSQLVECLNETHGAHARAFAATHGFDPEWPIWYADSMLARMNSLLPAIQTRSELVYLLVRLDKEYVRLKPPAAWADYYADFLLEHYGERPPEPAGSQDGDNPQP